MARFRIAILKGFAPAALALVLVAGPTGGVFAAPGQIHVVKSAGAALRAAPSTKAEVIGRLVGGDRVMEFEIRGGWLRVQQMGRVAPEGWVHGALVEPEPRLPVVKAPPRPESEDPTRPPPRRATAPGDGFVVTHRARRRSLARHIRLIRVGWVRHWRRPHHAFRVHRGRIHRDHQKRLRPRFRRNERPHGAACGQRRHPGSCLRARSVPRP